MLATVESGQLKKAFEDIKTLLAKAENDRLLTFTASNNNIYVTASSGMLYQRAIPTRCSDFFTVTVVYKDLSDLLETTGSCSIELNSALVSISTQVAIVTLPAGFTEKSMYNQAPTYTEHKIDVRFREIVLNLSAVATLEQTLLKEATYIFDGEFITVKYPTVWVRVPCIFVTTLMSKSSAEMLARFSPSKCIVGDDTLEFVRNNGLFAVPRVTVPIQESFGSLTEGMNPIAFVQSSSLLSRLKKVKSVIGNGFVHLSIYKEGLGISVNRSSVSLDMAHGDIKNGYKITVQVPLEYLVMCASLAKESDITFALEGGKLWIHSSNADILISV
jgi:hypothetical protein